MTFKFCLMQGSLICTFYFANMETDPFFQLLTRLLGLGATSNQKVALNQKLIFLGHLQLLFYARPLTFIKQT